jgi:prepilin-type processing-associated H-X9-DG protein
MVPFAEADDLYFRINMKKGWNSEENRFLALITLHYLQCPSYPDRSPENTLIPSHYVGIAGLGADAAALPLEDPRAGFFGFERQLKLSGIQGHTSTLLFALETLQVSGAWTAGGTATVRGLEENGLPYVGPKGQFGGIHRGGMNAAFADGSVRFIRDSVDPKVLEALATIQGSKNATSFGDE